MTGGVQDGLCDGLDGVSGGVKRLRADVGACGSGGGRGGFPSSLSNVSRRRSMVSHTPRAALAMASPKRANGIPSVSVILTLRGGRWHASSVNNLKARLEPEVA